MYNLRKCDSWLENYSGTVTNRSSIPRTDQRGEATLRINILRNEPIEQHIQTFRNLIALSNFSSEILIGPYDDTLAFWDNSFESNLNLIWLNWQRVDFQRLQSIAENYFKRLSNKRIATSIVLTGNKSHNAQIKEIFTNLNKNHIPMSWIDLEIAQGADGRRLYGFTKREVMQVLNQTALDRLPQLFSPAIKIICLDLDNTIYFGVLGEDGIEGIQVEESHRNLHQILLKINQLGIMIVIMTKNDIDDVKSLFNSEKFTSFRELNLFKIYAGWDPKHDFMEHLIEETNILPESCLFIDDNPGERLEMLTRFKDMLVIDGSDATKVTKALERMLLSRFLNSTVKSTDRETDLRARSKREKILLQNADKETLLTDIDTRIKTNFASTAAELERAQELLMKTNQFNCSLNRTNLRPDSFDEILVSEVSDKFSESGIVSVVHIKISGNVAEATEFVVSCRVLGRNLEKFILFSFLMEINAKYPFVRHLKVKYNPGSRNLPAFKFLKANLIEDNENQFSLFLDSITRSELAVLQILSHPETK